ncbi:GMC oxidoreductase-domain-containing protein [Aspergillus multicolor]|uniref:GMC family oxidoreductase n=1 Tax=Aspergillus multicolor TaxID=41759 RepID=UPI003CCD5A87
MVPASDFNSGELNGTAWASNTIHPRKQIRESSETSYLQSARRKTSLAVYEHTMALKIEFEGLTAVGVQVKTAGRRYTLRARKEIIVSAGAIQSPQLLMVSGVGPRSTLQPLGITVVADRAGVGQNMWDHPIFSVAYQVNVDTLTRYQTDPEYAAQVLSEYKLNRTGPLTTPIPGIIGWERLPNDLLSTEAQEALAIFPDDWPVVEYIARGTGLLDPSDASNGQQYAGIGAALVAPLSRGSISINSSNAEHPPLIDLGYLTHPVDREVAIAALRRTRQAFAASGVTIGEEYQPGPAVQTDEEILEYIRATISPVFHPAGTCVMGKESDAHTVVDSQARVIGVKNLRVVDASIFPALPPGHPQASCYMIAEKIAAGILNGTRYSP